MLLYCCSSSSPSLVQGMLATRKLIDATQKIGSFPSFSAVHPFRFALKMRPRHPTLALVLLFLSTLLLLLPVFLHHLFSCMRCRSPAVFLDIFCLLPQRRKSILTLSIY